MTNLDALKQDKIAILQNLQKAAADNDQEGFVQAFNDLAGNIEQSVLADAKELIGETDRAVLAQRGIRMLTSDERNYYQKVAVAMHDKDPRQAIANLDVVMPETIVNAVFEELQANHPLLSKIDFVAATALTKWLTNTNGLQMAIWGELSDEITKELSSGFKETDMTQNKLSAYLPISLAMLDLGPEFLDRYIRMVMMEAFAFGLENGIINGTGKNQPIGMIKQVGETVTVKGGVYPDKELVKLTRMDNVQLGALTAILATNEKGMDRTVSGLIMIVNPGDYYAKVLPATQFLTNAGVYANTLPYAIEIIPSPLMKKGKAVYGMASRYFMGLGLSEQGKLEYSDEVRFLQDQRVYKIKGYGNGFPKDNNSFLYLDISELQPAVYKVENITPAAVADNAELSDLKIGALTLTPDFSAETTTYTATTSNATNVISAVPAKASAEIVIKVGEDEIANNTAATWSEGSNTVTITVKDGEATKTYTVTVTKNV